MHPHLRLLTARLDSLEESISKLYANYRKRLALIEEKLSRNYSLVLEREHAKLKHITVLLSRALGIISQAKSAASAANESIAKLRLQSLVSEAEELLSRVNYGHVRVPLILRVEIYKLYTLLRDTLTNLQS